MIRLRVLIFAVGLGGCRESSCSAAEPTRSPANAIPIVPRFDGEDRSRPQVAVRWRPVAEGFTQVTDIQFPPARPDGGPVPMVVLQKGGEALVLGRPDGTPTVLFSRPVLTRSEMGLLGLAFHPDFWTNGLLYVDHSIQDDAGRPVTRISELRVDPTAAAWAATDERVLLEVVQPYANHDAGQLAFGADGYLYVGLGDGGSGGDPQGHGQNTRTLLGSMLRIDINGRDEGKAYAVPPDNPFVGRPTHRPEQFAVGLRNPWRYAFAPDGRLVVADVGQDTWEEVDIVSAGANLGWAAREGRHCFPPDVSTCTTAGLTDPIYEYAREDGNSITGGVVYTGSAIPELHGRYLFADFGSGRVWALTLPEGSPAPGAAGPLAPVAALGRVDWLPVTFGRDEQGEVYLADFGSGVIYRLEPG